MGPAHFTVCDDKFDLVETKRTGFIARERAGEDGVGGRGGDNDL